MILHNFESSVFMGDTIYWVNIAFSISLYTSSSYCIQSSMAISFSSSLVLLQISVHHCTTYFSTSLFLKSPVKRNLKSFKTSCSLWKCYCKRFYIDWRISWYLFIILSHSFVHSLLVFFIDCMSDLFFSLLCSACH